MSTFEIIIWSCVGGMSVGALVGTHLRDEYWIGAAKSGFRAHARGKLYRVTEDFS